MASVKTEQESSAIVFGDKDSLSDVMWDFSTGRPNSDSDISQTQLVLPVCYGRGLRFKDIHPPPVPKCCLNLLEKKAEIIPGRVPSTACHFGRGRGEAFNKRDLYSDVNIRPGGLLADIDVAVEKPNVPVENDDLIEDKKKSHAGWSVLPPHVVQLDGLPLDIDQDLLEVIIATHGIVQKSESRVTNGQTSVRFKLHSAEACNDLVLNMDGTDIFGSETSIKCHHL